MSEEEIIYILEEWFLPKAIECRKKGLADTEQIKFMEAIQGLLDLYNKEKEKRKYYEEELKATIQQSVSKHKIKEKIKIRKEEKAKSTDSNEAKLILREIYVLEELLEERKNNE